MDPLSLTLAAFALGTALKEIIVLAQKLDDTLEQVTRNMENARQLAASILKTLLQMEKLYNGHQDILESSTELKDALDGLKSDVQAAYTKCTELFKPAGKSNDRIDRAKLAFKAWKNRNKVETDITNLKHRVDACFLNFAILSSARIESNTLKVFDSTTRIERTTTRIEQLLVLDQSQLARLKKMEGIVACGPELSVAISDMYLRLQIDAVDQSLTELASSNKSYAIEDVMEEYTRPFHAVIPLGHNNLGHPTHQRAVIRKTLSILQNKSTHSQSLSIQEGAWEMVNLAIQLHHLDMLAEATTIGTWTVGLYKTLVKMDPAIYRPYLVLALHNLSRCYLTLDNQEEATRSIAECVKLNRVLRYHSERQYHG
ncbi:hypothetical protein B0H34DRAFT_799586 [Crassisporium funariophilum]|nr:hypothetical protein B0H34DRAFT_799586 [Crassisporium funariophilum]